MTEVETDSRGRVTIPKDVRERYGERKRRWTRYAKPRAMKAGNRRRRMYADTDFWVALLKDDDWLAERAQEVLEEHGDELEVSVVTFVELFLIEERYAFDRETAVTSILELASCTTLHGHGFEAPIGVEAGDSGGPFFTTDWFLGFGPAAIVAGMTHSGNPDDRVDYQCGKEPTGDTTRAYPMYDLDNRYGYSVSKYS